ncbi:GNAT family N-acetyltransferase [Nostoc sp.]
MGWCVFRYGFEGVKLNRIVAITLPKHTALRRMMEKCGMKYENKCSVL